MKIADRVLLPSVRRAAADTWLIADGFSCREQIAQGTGRRPIHTAEAACKALERASVAGMRSAGSSLLGACR